MSKLVIELKANNTNCDYNFKMMSKCETTAQLQAMKQAIILYFDVKIEEFKKKEESHDTI